MRAIRLTVSDISSGNETRTHRRTVTRPDMVMTISPAPTLWAEDKKGNLTYMRQLYAIKLGLCRHTLSPLTLIKIAQDHHL